LGDVEIARGANETAGLDDLKERSCGRDVQLNTLFLLLNSNSIHLHNITQGPTLEGSRRGGPKPKLR
jgi:hypothetical protein